MVCAGGDEVGPDRDEPDGNWDDDMAYRDDCDDRDHSRDSDDCDDRDHMRGSADRRDTDNDSFMLPDQFQQQQSVSTAEVTDI